MVFLTAGGGRFVGDLTNRENELWHAQDGGEVVFAVRRERAWLSARSRWMLFPASIRVWGCVSYLWMLSR